MYCVFSKFLLRRYANMHGLEPTAEDYRNIKPSKLIRNDFNITLLAFEYSPLLTIAQRDGLLGFMTCFPSILKWAKNNIIVNLKSMGAQTLAVKLRILTCMLKTKINNLPEHILWFEDPNDLFVILQNNFISNVKDLSYDISTEDLPF